MTSPSWPVTCRPGSPSIEVASTKSTSPPAPVTARPVATPGTDTRSARSSAWNRWRPEQVGAGRPRRPTTGRGGAAGDPDGHLAERLAELALELAHAGLAGVAGDDGAQRGVGDLDLVGVQAVAPHLPRSRWSRAMVTFSSSV